MLPMEMTSTRAPGRSRRCGLTSRQASDQLSLAEAIATGSSPAGSGTSIASAHGTRTGSENKPPQLPPIGAPYIARYGTAVQCADSPARQRSHCPQQMVHGTTTRPSEVRAPAGTVSWIMGMVGSSRRTAAARFLLRR